MQISQLPTSTIFNGSDVIAIEINGVTYKITGANLATALKALGSYVKTTGDTMTGTFIVETPAVISEKSTTMDLTVNPSSDTYTPAIYSRDKNNVNLSIIDSVQYSNGQTGMRFLICNYDGGTRTVIDGPRIYATRDGTITYAVPNAEAFRNAIGSNQANVTFNAGSNVAITRNNSFSVGKYIFVSVLIQTTAAIAGASTTLLSLPSGNTVIRMADLSALALNSTSQYSLVAVGGGGIIRSNLSGSLSMPAGYYHIVGNIELT